MFQPAKSDEIFLKVGTPNEADANARNDLEETPLHLASYNGRPRSFDENLRFEFSERQEYDRTKVIEILLKYGARKDVKNKENRTPLEEAYRHFRTTDKQVIENWFE